MAQSVAALGAAIIVLALAFDPFVQQALVDPSTAVAEILQDLIARDAVRVFGPTYFDGTNALAEAEIIP